MFKKSLLLNEKGMEVNIELTSPGAFSDPYFLTQNEMKFILNIKEYMTLKYDFINNKNMSKKERDKNDARFRSLSNRLNMIESVDKITNRSRCCYKYMDDFYEGRKLVVFISTNGNKNSINKIIRTLNILSYPLKNKVETITKYF